MGTDSDIKNTAYHGGDTQQFHDIRVPPPRSCLFPIIKSQSQHCVDTIKIPIPNLTDTHNHSITYPNLNTISQNLVYKCSPVKNYS